jgi:hypothetical protein
MDILNKLWFEPNNFKFDFFHEQSRLDELLKSNFEVFGGDNILNKDALDLEHPIKLNNIKILPYSYHRYWDDNEIKYVYHAGGDTPTKMKRIKKVLNQK